MSEKWTSRRLASHRLCDGCWKRNTRSCMSVSAFGRSRRDERRAPCRAPVSKWPICFIENLSTSCPLCAVTSAVLCSPVSLNLLTQSRLRGPAEQIPRMSGRSESRHCPLADMLFRRREDAQDAQSTTSWLRSDWRHSRNCAIYKLSAGPNAGPTANAAISKQSNSFRGSRAQPIVLGRRERRSPRSKCE